MEHLCGGDLTELNYDKESVKRESEPLLYVDMFCFVSWLSCSR
jgi:hypothetical protein